MTWRKTLRIKPQWGKGHFYGPDGTPRYDANITVARKEGLFPSVTTVNQPIVKPAVDAWSQNLLLDVAWEYIEEWTSEDDEEAWQEAVINEWEIAKAAARELGTAYHDAIEEMLRADDWTIRDLPTGVKRPVLESVKEWMVDNHVNIHGIEESFSHPLGFGGKIDLHGTWGLSQRPLTHDWKSQGKPGDALSFYPDMAIQLAANAALDGKLDGDLVSWVFSTVEPGEYRVKVWGDNQYWFDRFMNRFAVWQDEKKYHPVLKTVREATNE
jgi:hypothetical protein